MRTCTRARNLDCDEVATVRAIRLAWIIQRLCSPVSLVCSTSLRVDDVDSHQTEAFRKPCKQAEALSEAVMWAGAAGTEVAYGDTDQ